MTSFLIKIITAAAAAVVLTPSPAVAAEFCVYSQTMGIDPYSVTTPKVCIPFPPPPAP